MDKMPHPRSEAEKPFQNVTETPRLLTKSERGTIANRFLLSAALLLGQGTFQESAKDIRHLLENVVGVNGTVVGVLMGDDIRRYPTLENVCVARGPDGKIFVDIESLPPTKEFRQYQRDLPSAILINNYGVTIRCNFKTPGEMPKEVPLVVAQGSQAPVGSEPVLVQKPQLVKKQTKQKQKPAPGKQSGESLNWSKDLFKN